MPEAPKACSCSSCELGKTLQPAENFGINNSTASGRAHACRKCATRMQAAWKKANPEKAKKWRSDYVERNKARNQARRAAEGAGGAASTE